MMANALFASSAIMLALLFCLMSACRFLIPYRAVLLHDYGMSLLLWAGVLFVNLFAVIYTLCRIIGLKDTGRKLAHVEKQLRAGGPIARDLADRLGEE
jgi:hypothetical protein